MRLRVLAFVALLCTLAQAGITITNSTVTFDLEATGVTRFFKGPSFAEFTAPLVAFDSDVDKSNSVVLVTPVSGATWETLIRNEVVAGARGIVIFNRFWTYQPGRIELIFDGTDLSEVDAPTVEIIQSLGNEIYDQLKRGEAITVTMRCCDPNIWTETYASFSVLMTVICAAGSAAVISCALWKLLLFTNMFRTWRPMNLAKVLLLLIIIASLAMGVMISLDPFWTNEILTFAAGSYFISSPVTCAYTVTLLITFYWLELIKKKDNRVNTVLRKFKVPYIIAIIVIWIIEIVNSTLRAVFLDLNTMTTVGIVISACVAVTIAVVFLWSTIRILLKLQTRQNVASKNSSRLRKSSIMIMVAGLSNSFAIVMYVITFTNFYHTPYGFPLPFFLSYLWIQATYLLQIFAFVPPKNKYKSDSGKVTHSDRRPSSVMLAQPELTQPEATA